MTVNYLPPPRPLPEQRVQQLREHLQRFVVTEREPAPKRSRWRRRGFLGGAGAAILLAAGTGTAVAYVLLHPKPVTNFTSARCYRTATYTGTGASFPGMELASAPGKNWAGGIPHALDACAQMWAGGFMQPGLPSGHPPQGGYAVPPLVGCTLPNGIAAIFPGPPDTCERLGLPAQTPVPTLHGKPAPAITLRPSSPG